MKYGKAIKNWNYSNHLTMHKTAYLKNPENFKLSYDFKSIKC